MFIEDNFACTMDAMNPPAHTDSSTGKASQPLYTLIKSHCDVCACYEDCPRMRGENVCYGKKERLYPSSVHSSGDFVEEEAEDESKS